jgi:hypothetical protein
MLLVNDNEPEIRKRDVFVKQRMRADNDLRRIIARDRVRPERDLRLGSALVSRAVFGIPRKRTFLEVFGILPGSSRLTR